jgi:hypothetical protein
MYIEYSAVIFSTKFKSKISVTYQQDTVTSALCRSEIPNLGRAKLSGRHHWCKNTFFLLVLAVHGMIIYAMRLPLEVIWQYLLQWLRSQGCPWDTRTCIMAASYGYMEVLQWASSQGCPWDSSTCYNAALRDNLAVLKYMLQCRCWRSFESITVRDVHGIV